MKRITKIQDYLNKLYKLERSIPKYDLDVITSLAKKLKNPQNNYKTIHIAGTNGKGATSSFLASILYESGIKTGLYTSPHILKFNERIRINSKQIPDDYIISFVNKNKYLFKKLKPSFFEVNTAMAFKYFSDKKADLAVIETGLGGRLDSTNIINPELSIITEIGMDHTEFLGKTLKKIAKEKAGIIKEGTDVIISDSHEELRDIFRKAGKKNNLYYIRDLVKYEVITEDKTHTTFNIELNFDNKKITLKNCAIPLHGEFQIINAAAAIYAFLILTEKNNLDYSGKIIKKGLKNIKINSGYKGRLEIVKYNKNELILDVSHNYEGIKKTSEYLKKNYKNLIVIFSCASDKDYKEIIKVLTEFSGTVIFTKMSYERGVKPEELFIYAKNLYLNKKVNYYYTHNLQDAMSIYNIIKNGNEPLLITGSFFLISDAIKELKLYKYFN